MKYVLIIFAIPFITILISVLLVCAVALAPFFLVGYIWTTRQRKERRESEFYPNEKIDLKSMIQRYKNSRK